MKITIAQPTGTSCGASCGLAVGIAHQQTSAESARHQCALLPDETEEFYSNCSNVTAIHWSCATWLQVAELMISA
jgi:hypothetical protein